MMKEFSIKYIHGKERDQMNAEIYMLTPGDFILMLRDMVTDCMHQAKMGNSFIAGLQYASLRKIFPAIPGILAMAKEEHLDKLQDIVEECIEDLGSIRKIFEKKRKAKRAYHNAKEYCLN